MFLQEMRGHEHIITLTSAQADNDRDIYLVLDYGDGFAAAIRANILQDIHKQYIIWQALKRSSTCTLPSSSTAT